MTKVLLVDDDAALREALTQTLELAGYQVISAGSFIVAKDNINTSFEGVVLSDIRMPGKDGFHLLEYARKQDPDLPVILLTGEGDVPMAVRGMSGGAFGFLEKPCETETLKATIDRAGRARDMVLENRRMKQQLRQGDAAARMLFGHSDKADALRNKVRIAATAGTEVLVCGETGSGTAKVAEVIHLLARGARAPFEKRAAAGLSRETIRTAFTAAEGGTLFLDEIAGLSPDLQLWLLDRLEQDRTTCLIAGTYQDLSALVAEGRFHPDLVLRLDLMRVRIPSLKERPDDIPVLFRHYVAQAAEQANLSEPEITSEMTSRLMAQDWPGNARALMNEAMRFVMGVAESSPSADEGLNEQLARVEAALLREALQRHNGHASEAAKALKLPRKTFYDRLSRYDIRAEDYRRIESS